MLVVGFSLETDRKIDGYGLRVTKIGAEVVASVLLALHLHHGDMSKAGVYAIVPSGADMESHVLVTSSL